MLCRATDGAGDYKRMGLLATGGAYMLWRGMGGARRDVGMLCGAMGGTGGDDCISFLVK